MNQPFSSDLLTNLGPCPRVTANGAGSNGLVKLRGPSFMATSRRRVGRASLSALFCIVVMAFAPWPSYSQDVGQQLWEHATDPTGAGQAVKGAMRAIAQ